MCADSCGRVELGCFVRRRVGCGWIFARIVWKLPRRWLSLQRVTGKPLPNALLPMSKVRIPINPKQVGRVGAYSMYVRAGEQIVRQRQNASNYGETASRTHAQQLRRVMWSNLVNQYRVLAYWQPRAYENIRAGQTDYNKFMSLNVNAATLPLTKQMASDGATIITPVIVSQGSLPSPVTLLKEDSFVLDLIADADAAAAMNTVGDFSAIVIQWNPNFIAGDALCFVGARNWVDLSDTPRASCDYVEVVLNPADTTPLTSLGAGFSLGWNDESQQFTFYWSRSTDQPVVAGTCIHTRRNVSSLAVSTEKLVMLNEDIIDMYSGEEWLQECIDSYGVSTLVPLEPGKSAKSFTAAFAHRNSTAAGSLNMQFLVDERGRYYTAANGYALCLNGSQLNLIPEADIPSDVSAWGSVDGGATIDGNSYSVKANGGKFTFSIFSGNLAGGPYPRMLTYRTEVPA